MGNSRRSRPADPEAVRKDNARQRGRSRAPADADHPVLAAVRGALAHALASRADDSAAARIVIALSGGRDSIALLDALARLAAAHRVTLSAMHVHHGLSANADAWAAFCAAECSRRDVPLVIRRVRVEHRGGTSLEAEARSARYAALGAAEAEFVALAHHADDQAETLLLQLLRGAGPHGLAAMPAQRAGRPGVVLLRPFLALPRSVIDAYARARGLAWVDDESNADIDVRRNFVRHEIANRLAAAFPGYPETLVRSAAHQAEAATLIDELAAEDAAGAIVVDSLCGATLSRAALIALDQRAPHRARNLLRWFLRQHELRHPSTARLKAMHEQLLHAAPDARVTLVHGGAVIGIHRDRIAVHPPAVPAFEIAWRGEAQLALPHGTLAFVAGTGAALRAALPNRGVVIRVRTGGERIQLAPDRQPRALKRILQEVEMPFWVRDSLPLVFCGDTLAVVPGVGVAAAFRAPAGAAGYAVDWHPAAQRG